MTGRGGEQAGGALGAAPCPDAAVEGPAAVLPLMQSLETADAAVSTLQLARLSGLTDEQHADLLRSLVQLRARVEAAYLHAVAGFDTRDGAVPGAPAGAVAARFLTQACRIDPAQAMRDVRAARLLDPTGVGFGEPDGDPQPAAGDETPDPPELPDTPELPGEAPEDAHLALPRCAALLAAGLVGREQVDSVVRCVRDLPTRLLREVGEDGRRGIELVDELLADHARALDAAQLRRLGKHLLEVTDAGRRHRDGDDVARRALSYRTGEDGMLVGRLVLDAADGARFSAVITALVSASMAQGTSVVVGGDVDRESGQPQVEPASPLPDDRRPAQRRADALMALIGMYSAGAQGDEATDAQRRGAHHPDAQPPSRGTSGISTEVTVSVWATAAQVAAARATTPAPVGLEEPGATHAFVTPESMAQTQCSTLGVGSQQDLAPAPGWAVEALTGQPLPPNGFGRLLCEAVLYPVLHGPDGAVLRHGRATRLATAAQRRAVIARDRGCVAPGCTAPPQWCEVHHAVWWRHGGTTDLENLALLCGRHHSAVHAGHWRLQMINGLAWMVAPRIIDPEQRPRRNTSFHADHRARAVAVALRARRAPQPDVRPSPAGARAGP